MRDITERLTNNSVISMTEHRLENPAIRKSHNGLLAALQGLLAKDVEDARQVIDFGPGGTTAEQAADRLIFEREEAARAAIAKALDAGAEVK